MLRGRCGRSHRDHGAGGGTHDFLAWLTTRSRRLHYSAGMTITADIQDAIGKVPAAAWTPAMTGTARSATAEITGMLDLTGWPAGCGSGAAPGARTGSFRNAKDTGLRNLPLHGYAQNQIWCEIIQLACELLAWTQMLALPGAARRWEPKRLRLQASWPWVGLIITAATRLAALPSG